MSTTVQQLATLVRGDVLGNQQMVIQSARGLEDAQEGDITCLDDPLHVDELLRSKAWAAVVSTDLPTCGKALIRVREPLAAFAAIASHLKDKSLAPLPVVDPRANIHAIARVGEDASIDPSVVIGANTTIGKRCRLHAGVVIGKNCRLGDDVVLYSRVVLYDDCLLGDRVVIQAKTSIGGDGFGYRFLQGRHVKVPQLGNVVLGNDVHIGASSTVDRGTFGSTRIGDRTTIGNLVQIAHNCQIGMQNVLGNHVGIAGSSQTGIDVVMGDQSGAKDHMVIGDRVVLGPGTGIINDVPAGAQMFGYPAFEQRESDEIFRCLKRLPAMNEELLRVLERLDLAEEDAA